MSEALLMGGLLVAGYSAYTDLSTGKILNKVVLPAICVCLIIIGIWQPEFLVPSLKYGAISWGCAAAIVLLGLMGGGDAKLFALVGIIFKENTVYVWLWFCLLIPFCFFIANRVKGYGIKESLEHIFLLKRFIGQGTHHHTGGLLIFLASLITAIQILA